MEVTFFRSPAALRRWLTRNHDKADEVWIGFHKVGTGKKGITSSEALDEALCFGWIDGIRRGIDDVSYMNRFTPRRRNSNWSQRNTKRAKELIDAGRMHPAGRKAFNERDPERSGSYSYEQRPRGLDGSYEKRLRAHRKAWDFFQAQPPSYRRAASYWVTSAKKEETRLRRLATLIDDSANGRTIAPLTRRPRT